MEVVGFQDNQGRPSSDDGWIENQNGRYILYMTNSPGSGLNPQTGKVENNGTSLIDVTDPAKPVFLHHIPTETKRRRDACRGVRRQYSAACAEKPLVHAAP